MNPFIGTIQAFSFNFVPRGWASCQGQLMPINQHRALFSLIGTTYGGDGRTTFALPDLRGRVLIGAGQGPGLSNYREGAKGGQESFTLTVAQMPAHNHSFNLSDGSGADGQNNFDFIGADNGLANISLNIIEGETNEFIETFINPPRFTGKTLASDSIGSTGNNQAVNNMQPYLTVNYCIALEGIYPACI